ncbi:MAG: excinuclease ABC subunit UvrA [Rickettsiales bacterium]|jgi:excinuclease ABC subunit A|nr:excinuclease ABC subunit UvrA [Rickettsiales bacterium]
MGNIIKIRGAREHNLKGIDIDIPKNKLVVITGVSGSGKSSLAFNTIYAEGQRRYVESLSSYARQFLNMQKKPDVDLIEGLAPAISIEQKTTGNNPRSTVGTVTEIYDYLRLLWARAGVPHSPITGLPIKSQTIPEMIQWVMKLPRKTKIYVMAPLVRGRKGEYKKEMMFLVKQGYGRAMIDGKLIDLDPAPILDKNKKHDIFVIVDRLEITDDKELAERLAQSFESSLRLVKGSVFVHRLDTNENILFSREYACPVSGFTVPKIEPRLFTFNAPLGACGECGGLGVKLNMSPDLIIPDKTLSVRNGALAPYSRNGMISQYENVMESLSKKYKFKLTTPWEQLPDGIKNIVLYGSSDKITMDWNGYVYEKEWEGVVNNLERRWREATSDPVKDELAKYISETPCHICHGKRLNIHALCVKINGLDIMDVTEMSVEKSLEWFLNLPKSLDKKENEIASPILREITARLHFLKNVGLGYLTMSRLAGTLSGGESQRIRLASQIGSGLSGVLYVLDEPSIGLHQSDNDKLLDSLKELRDKDNTVIVVEHDEDAMRSADYLIDIGRGAGINGGTLIAHGTADEVIKNKNSLTGQYLSGEKKIDVPKKRREGNGESVKIFGAKQNNLKNINVEIPLGKFVVFTGVSGSGKSTLLLNTLYPMAMRALYNSRYKIGEHSKISGLEHIDKVVDINQSPIGRSPRSNPATYVGLFTDIRDFFAELPESKARGYGPGRFSFNVKGGRCEACEGDGVIRIEMNFMPDVYVECEQCNGKRYNEETLKVRYKDKSIADVLDMTVDEAYRFFINVPRIKNKLELLKRVGLDYIELGQSSLELSGGEAQRVKLSKELAARGTGRTLYILDEPTTGLHFDDIKMLLSVLQSLVDTGNSVVVIEHNLDVVKSADWVIDLGPGGGEHGGEVVAFGTPEDIAKNPKSLTGRYLKKALI